MRIACEQCGTAYEVDPGQIPATGMSIKCTVCFHSFTIMPPGDAAIGIELSDDGSDMQLSNDPTDIPQAPVGYVDPTNLSIEGPGNIGLADLPGLPRSPAQPGLADLPGLPQPPAQPGLADLPGLPQRPAQPGLTDLPGLAHNQPPGGMDLPELPPASAGTMPGAAPYPPMPGAGSLPNLTDLPGLPQRGNQAPGLTDLPGLTHSQPPGLTDLPGLTHNQPSGLTDLPGLVSGSREAPVGVGLSYGELPLSADAPPLDLAMDLPAPVDNIGLPAPVDNIGLPAPVDNIGLPAPSGGIGLPAPVDNIGLPAPSGGIGLPAPVDNIGLPAPSGGIGLPAPVDNIGLPAPSGGIDLPAPSGGIDLPMPSGGIDLPAPSGGIDLPMPSGGIDLPMPSGGVGLPAPVDNIGLPAPSGGVDLPAPMGGIDVVAPKPDQDEIIRFEVPEGVEKLPPASEDLLPEVPDSKPVDIREKRRLPSKIVLIGGGVGLAVLVGGLILILSLIGSSEKSPGQLSIEKGQKLLKLDTYSGYAQAVKAFVTASAALDSKEIPAALQAQAEAIRTIRYNLKKVGTAAQLIKPFAKADKPTQDLLVARALVLFARHDAKTFKALKKCADDRPQDSLASLYLAWFHEKKRHRGAAKVAYKRALAADATLPGALYGLGHLELQTGHSKAARPFFKKALVSSPDHVEALLGTVRLDIIDHKLKAAEKRLNRVGVLSKQHRLSREEKATVYVRRAQLAEAKGDTNKARLFYLDALKLDILSVDALVGAGKIYLASKKYQEANVSFRNAQKIDPMNVEVSLLLATTRLRLGLPAEARDALMPILKREKKNPKIHLVLGTIELAVGAHRAAVKEFKEAITSDPKFFPAYHALAQLYVNRGKSSNAFAVLKKARKALSGEARVLNAIGEIYLAIRQFPAARTRFEEALAKDNNFNLALFNLATTLRQQDKLAAARKAYEKLERRDAHFPGLDAGFGALYTALKEPKEAAASYAKALAADMPSTTLHLEAGQAFINAGLWEKAISEADAALKDPKATSDALALRAEARLVQEDLGDALIEIQRALGREKKSHYFVIYAKILERLHRLADAVKAYKDALKLDPKRIDLRLHRARLQVRGGAVKSAIKELKRIVKAKPKMAEAHFFMGLALADLGKEDKAKRAYEHAISLDPKLAEAHYRLGRLLDDKHKFKAAQKHLEKATALGNKTTPWWTDAYFAVGRIAQTRKQKMKAIAAYQRVLQVARPGDANRQMAIRRLKALGAWKEKED